MEEVRFLVFGSSEGDRQLTHRLTDLGGVAALVPPPEDVGELKRLIGDYARMGPGLFIHPGTGHWKRRSELQSLAAEFDATVLGPSAHATSLWNHALNFLSTLETLRIPNLLVGLYPFYSANELKKWLQQHEPELPLRIRSVSGRGAFATYLLKSYDDRGLDLFFEQLKLNVADPLVMIERFREGGRHVRLPFARLPDGGFFGFALQDLSIQYRGRPWLEITPPESIEDETRLILETRAADIAAHTDFVGVGALDFILDGTQSYLHQGIPGLTEGYEGWEEVSQTRAIDWQLAGAGLAPTPRAPHTSRCCICFRITPEDIQRNLLQTGEIDDFESDSKVFRHEGDIAIGRVVRDDFKSALRAFQNVLKNSWYSGEIQTNERVLKEVLSHPQVRVGVLHRDFLEEEFLVEASAPPELVQAAVDACATVFTAHFSRWVAQRKKIQPQPDQLVWSKAPVLRPNGFEGVLKTHGRLAAHTLGEGLWNVRIQDYFILVRADRDIPQNPKLYSLISGRVHAVFYRVGAEIPAHEPVLLIESQRLLFPLPLPVKVKLLSLKVQTGDRVHMGEDLADLEVIR